MAKSIKEGETSKTETIHPTMRSPTIHEEQPKEGSPSHTQDPIERRRLQNRLAQRNHRRKIRDRIAKLQERVIASELRAVASLNGWDQTNSSAMSAVEPQPHGFETTSLSPGPDTSPLPLRVSHHRSSSTGLCPSCSSMLGQIPPVSTWAPSPSPFDLGIVNGLESSSSSSSALLSTSCPSSSQVNPFNLDATLSTTRLHLGNQFENDLGFPQYPEPPGTQQHQQTPQYYVATEASLPQIMQSLGHGPSRPKAIILIPQGSLPEGIPSTHFNGVITSDPIPLRGPSAVQNPGCHCPMQDSGARTADLGTSAEWISPSSPPSLCPLHSMHTQVQAQAQAQAQVQSQPPDHFQRMML